VVGTAGFEPATLGLEIRCSIRLSYAPVGQAAENALLSLWHAKGEMLLPMLGCAIAGQGLEFGGTSILPWGWSS
jgi:hypothetical protein